MSIIHMNGDFHRRHEECKLTGPMQCADVTVILPFRDHEHLVGRACRRLADHFRAANIAFEIVAVDQGSGDNSQPMLHLLRSEIPELRVIIGRGYGAGAQIAEAPVMLLLPPERAAEGFFTSLVPALAEVGSKELDMKLLDRDMLVCATSSCAHFIAKGPQGRAQLEAELLQVGRSRGLAVRSYGPEEPRGRRRLSQVIKAVVPRAAGLHRAW